MPRPFFSGDGRLDGGLIQYPQAQLMEEMAFIAYHFGWPAETVLQLEHEDRREWVRQISLINQQMNEA